MEYNLNIQCFLGAFVGVKSVTIGATEFARHHATGLGSCQGRTMASHGWTIFQTEVLEFLLDLGWSYMETGGGGDFPPLQTVFFWAATRKIWAPVHAKISNSSPREKFSGHISSTWSKNAFKCIKNDLKSVKNAISARCARKIYDFYPHMRLFFLGGAGGKGGIFFTKKSTPDFGRDHSPPIPRAGFHVWPGHDFRFHDFFAFRGPRRVHAYGLAYGISMNFSGYLGQKTCADGFMHFEKCTPVDEAYAILYAQNSILGHKTLFMTCRNHVNPPFSVARCTCQTKNPTRHLSIFTCMHGIHIYIDLGGGGWIPPPR